MTSAFEIVERLVVAQICRVLDCRARASVAPQAPDLAAVCEEVA